MGYLLLHREPVYPRAQSQEYVVPSYPYTYTTIITGAQSQEYVGLPIPMLLTYCYTENQYILEYNHRSKLYLRFLYIYHWELTDTLGNSIS